MAAAAVAPSSASASCNVIPAALEKGFYASAPVDVAANVTGPISGKIDSRIIVPGEKVTVSTECVTGSPTFQMNQLNRYSIKLEVYDFSNGGSVSFGPRALLNPSVPDGCPTNGDCSRLSFEVPMPTASGGLAGPTKLTVLDGTTVKVVIDALFPPTDSCTIGRRDTVFETLVLLPTPNNFVPTGEGNTESNHSIKAALDNRKNLLIPFNFDGETQKTTAPIATLLAGFSDSNAERTPPDTHPRTIRERLAARPNRDSLIRVFTLQGRPLPPLLRVDADGGVFGLVDAPASVIRIENVDIGGGKPLFDITYRIPQEGRPVSFDYKSRNGVMTPVPLYALRSSSNTVVYARDEAYEKNDSLAHPGRLDLVPEVVAVSRGRPQRGWGVTVAGRPFGNFMNPLMEVAGDYATFLEPTYEDGVIVGHKHRILSSEGTLFANPPDASDADRIGGEPIAISEESNVTDPRVFFLKPESDHDKLAVVRLPSGNGGEEYATKAAVADGRAVLLVPESVKGNLNQDADAFDEVAHFMMLRNNDACTISLDIERFDGTRSPVAASDVAISDKIVAVTASEVAHRRASDTHDLNRDDDYADDIVYVWAVSELVAACDNNSTAPVGQNTSFAADKLAAWGEYAVFIAAEAEQKLIEGCGVTNPSGGCDLNSDEDPNDHVLMVAVHGMSFAEAWSSGAAAVDFELDKAGNFIALRVPEWEQEDPKASNQDSDDNDAVLHVYRPYCSAGALKTTGWSALACDFAACDPRHHYRIDGETIWFITDDRQPVPAATAAVLAPACDRLYDFRIPELYLEPSQIKLPPWTDPFPFKFLDTSILVVKAPAEHDFAEATALYVAGDADRDSILDPFDNCEEFPNTDSLDVDKDGVGDKHCDLTPAVCPKHADELKDCMNITKVAAGNLCLARTAQPGELDVALAWQADARQAERIYVGEPILGRPHYSLCVYSDADRRGPIAELAALPWPECGDPPCWIRDETRGLVFHGDRKLVGNLETLVLPTAAAKDQTIFAKGTVTARGDLEAALERQVRAHLILHEGGKRPQCWTLPRQQPKLDLATCMRAAPPSPTAPAASASERLSRDREKR